jgi:hypothetical protein
MKALHSFAAIMMLAAATMSPRLVAIAGSGDADGDGYLQLSDLSDLSGCLSEAGPDRAPTTDDCRATFDTEGSAPRGRSGASTASPPSR